METMWNIIKTETGKTNHQHHSNKVFGVNYRWYLVQVIPYWSNNVAVEFSLLCNEIS